MTSTTVPKILIIAMLLWAAIGIIYLSDAPDQPALDPLMGEHCLDAPRYNYAHRFEFDSLYVAKDFGDGEYQTYFFNNGKAILPWFSTTADSLKAYGG